MRTSEITDANWSENDKNNPYRNTEKKFKKWLNFQRDADWPNMTKWLLTIIENPEQKLSSISFSVKDAQLRLKILFHNLDE